MNLLVIEDEIKTADTLKKGLEEKGYNVQLAYDGELAWKLAQENTFDLMVMDVIMPRLNGLDLCRRLRDNQIETPIIMLSALGFTVDKIKGFEYGADDYMVKPFDFEELLARIKVATNRSAKKANGQSTLVYGNLTLNFNTKEVQRDGISINLTAKEYALLEYFMHNINKVVSKEDLAEKVWNLNFDTGTNFIEVYVSYLRNKIDKGFKTRLIHTKKGMGYIFREEI